jgi:tRNA nucleotidyltransferase (CCA-adding enzyme)
VRVELGYLLSNPNGTLWLEQLYADGLLDHFFPDLKAEGVAKIGVIDQAAIAIGRKYPPLLRALHQPLSDRAQGPEAHRRTVLSTVKLMGLVSPDAAITEITLSDLKYSRNEIRLVCTLIQAFDTLRDNFETLLKSKSQQYYLFKQVGQYFPALVLIAIATGYSLELQGALVETYLDSESPVAHPKPIVSGSDLIQALGLEPGPQIGKLLSQIAIAQAEGTIHSKSDAIAFVKQQLL